MAGKMHELLAAETNVKAVYNAMLDESLKVMETAAHFTKTIESVEFFDASQAERENTSKTKDIVTTVSKRLSYFFGRPFVNAIDLMIQKDSTNQGSAADLVVNGQTILRNVPAVTLLTWEGQLGGLRALLLKIPTLQSGPVWVHDDSQDLWRHDPAVTFMTKKISVPVVLYDATKEHPAQVKEVFEDKAVAKKTVTTYSGMWTSAQKSDIIARLDSLVIAVKKARQRANQAKVTQVTAGALLANFIMNGPAADALTGTDTVDAA